MRVLGDSPLTRLRFKPNDQRYQRSQPRAGISRRRADHPHPDARRAPRGARAREREPGRRRAAAARREPAGAQPAPRARPIRSLEIALPLRRLASHPDLDSLRERLVQMVRTFERNGRALGVPDAQLGPARYCLCTFIDEAIAATPWGAGA